MASVNSWAIAITDGKGLLDSDVRIRFENNCLKVEKWKKNKCQERIYITHYSQSNDPAHRDITNVRQCEGSTLGY